MVFIVSFLSLNLNSNLILQSVSLFLTARRTDRYPTDVSTTLKKRLIIELHNVQIVTTELYFYVAHKPLYKSLFTNNNNHGNRL